MRFTLLMLFSGIFCLLAGIWFPWWSLAPVAFLLSWLLALPPFRSWLAGFLGVFLAWGCYALLRDQANHQILSSRISLLILHRDSPSLLVGITALIGGLVGGLSAWTAALLRSPERRAPCPSTGSAP